MKIAFSPYGEAVAWFCGWITGNLRTENLDRAYFSGRLTALALFAFVAMPLAFVFPALPAGAKGPLVLFLLPAIAALYGVISRLGLEGAAYRPAFRSRLVHLGLLYALGVAGLAGI